MTISASFTGDFGLTEAWMRKMLSGDIFNVLTRYGQMGVDALSRGTPVETGETAQSWYYEIVRDGQSYSIIWGNSHVEDGRPIAILLQYGHGTGTGGYVEGRDYINPAIQPIFDQMAAEAWKAVTAT